MTDSHAWADRLWKERPQIKHRKTGETGEIIGRSVGGRHTLFFVHWTERVKDGSAYDYELEIAPEQPGR